MSAAPVLLQPTNSTFKTSSKNAIQPRAQKDAHTSDTRMAASANALNQSTQQKKIPRRSSKPILNWFQRKLSGTVRGKRIENLPLTIADLGLGRSAHNPTRVVGRVTSSPLPSPAFNAAGKPIGKRENGSLVRRKTFSLTEDDEARDYTQSFIDDNISLGRSSFARDSIWSPASALEADDDASLRPLPPSSPPSPSPSRSSSSYLSDPRTFRSMTASTKPTTILSIDLHGNGMAHIAQVPPSAAPNPVHRFAPHIRHSSSLSSPGHIGSGASITFSALPSAQTSSRPPSALNPGSISSLNFNQAVVYSTGPASPTHIQAPLHTTHHPRNNPRPSSPPLDNASMLTLASSAYALPTRNTLQAYSNASALGDTASHYGGSITFPDGESTSQYVLGDDDRLEERDVDASMRALRPRSSRRGSWESEASRWSARVQFGTGTPSLARERSLWTTNSIRTGVFSTENGDMVDRAYGQNEDDVFGDKLNEMDVPPIFTHSPVETTNSDPFINSALIHDLEESQVLHSLTSVNLEEGHAQLHRVSTETIAQVNAASNVSKDDSKSPVNFEDKALAAEDDAPETDTEVRTSISS